MSLAKKMRTYWPAQCDLPRSSSFMRDERSAPTRLRRRTYGSLVFDPSGDCAEGNYNTWCGLAVDGRPGQCGKIVAHKVLITNRTIGYEAKGKDAITAPNYAHVIILTNNDWAVQTGADARRWMVLDMSEMRMGDHDYFLELSDERDNGGTAAFLDYLMKVDLSGFNPRALPKTEGLQAQRAETFGRTNPVAAFLMRVLSEGSFWSKAELCRGRSLPAARAERGTGAL